MLWGLSGGGWMAGIIRNTDDPQRTELELLAENGLHACEWSSRALMEMEPARLEEIAGWLEELDIRAVIGIGLNYFAEDPADTQRSVERALEAIAKLSGPMRAPLCLTGAGPYHQWTREPSLQEQWDRLTEVLTPVAQVAYDAGCPVAVHNSNRAHYAAEYAGLCQRVPHLGMMWDVSNPFLVGEHPERAAMEIAPYVFGCHFKDHYAHPGCEPVTTRTTGAVPGEGDVPLRDIYQILMDATPNPDDLVMLFELDPVEGAEQADVLAKAAEFAHSL